MRRAGAAVIAATLTLAAAGGEVPLEPVPLPSIDNLEPVAREQLDGHRRTLDELLAGEAEPAALASAFGELGRLYYLYDLPEPAAAALGNAARLAPERFEWSYLLGVLARKEGRMEEARRWLARALEIRPGDRTASLRLAEVELESGRLESAEALYRRVLEDSGGEAQRWHAAAWYGLGRIAYQREEPAAAIERLERTLELQPEASAVNHLLGLAYRATGNLDAARRHLSANRHGAVRYPDPVVDELATLVRSAQFYLKAANRAAGRGRLEAARQMLGEAVEIDPDDPLVRYNLALVLLRQGDEAGAERELGRALAADPDYRNAHYNLATLLAQQERWPEAVIHFRRAVEIDARDLEARRLLFEALLAAGELAAAAEALDGWQASPGAEPAALVEANRRLAARFGQRGELAAAAERFAAVVRLAPDDEQARFGLATALILGGRHGEARDELEAALERLQQSVPLAHALARLLAASPDPAVRDGGRALALARAVFDAAQTLDHAETVAMALAETGDFAAAASLQRQVVARAEAAGATAAAERARRRLAEYQQGRPVRSPWDGGR